MSALQAHLQLFVDAYNHARRLKTLKGLTPYEFICQAWAKEPDRFRLDPSHHIPGPYSYVIAIDAASDPDCTFADLGNAVRKIKIDLGVDIEFQPIRIAARAKVDARSTSFAIGRIKYAEAAGDQNRWGWLLYVKPTYLGDLPVDVRAYAEANALFPHEPTTDQWFGESQFESYRRLGGEHLMGLLRPDGGHPEIGLSGMFLRAEKVLASGTASPVARASA